MVDRPVSTLEPTHGQWLTRCLRATVGGDLTSGFLIFGWGILAPIRLCGRLVSFSHRTGVGVDSHP